MRLARFAAFRLMIRSDELPPFVYDVRERFSASWNGTRTAVADGFETFRKSLVRGVDGGESRLHCLVRRTFGKSGERFEASDRFIFSVRLFDVFSVLAAMCSLTACSPTSILVQFA